MSEETAELFREWNAEKKRKRWANHNSSMQLLDHYNISYVVLNPNNMHVRVMGCIDFWPTTGKWKVRGKKKHYRGVKKLIKYVVDNELTDSSDVEK